MCKIPCHCITVVWFYNPKTTIVPLLSAQGTRNWPYLCLRVINTSHPKNRYIPKFISAYMHYAGSYCMAIMSLHKYQILKLYETTSIARCGAQSTVVCENTPISKNNPQHWARTTHNIEPEQPTTQRWKDWVEHNSTTRVSNSINLRRRHLSVSHYPQDDLGWTISWCWLPWSPSWPNGLAEPPTQFILADSYIYTMSTVQGEMNT